MKTNFKYLIGKTIVDIDQMKLKEFDDDGFLKIKFNDDTEIVIVSTYGNYTSDSENEYPTSIYIDKGEYKDKLEKIN